MKLQQLQTIEVKFLGWTTTQLNRIKITDTRFNKSKIINFDDKIERDIKDQAIVYLKRLHGTINVLSFSYIEKTGSYNLHVNFGDDGRFESIFN